MSKRLESNEYYFTSANSVNKLMRFELTIKNEALSPKAVNIAPIKSIDLMKVSSSLIIICVSF